MAAKEKNTAEVRAEKDKVLRLALVDIDKRFGRGAIMRLGSNFSAEIDVIPTGSITLDLALGAGGIPRGRVTEVFGGESSGKTTLTLHAIANAQAAGGTAAFIDAEHALDPTYAKKLGVNLDNLLVSQPNSGEEALEIAEALVRSNGLDIVVVDSVAALVPKAEIEGEMGDSHMGLQARLMSQALRKLTSAIHSSNTSMVFINQVREKIGGFGPGSPVTTTGGRALKFYAFVRIDMARIQTLKVGEVAVGNRVRANVVKNKIAPPFRKAEFDLVYGKGISVIGEVLDAAVEMGFVEKSGAWYTYKEEHLGQGRDASITELENNKPKRQEIETAVRAKMFAKETAKEAVVEEKAKKAG